MSDLAIEKSKEFIGWIEGSVVYKQLLDKYRGKIKP